MGVVAKSGGAAAGRRLAACGETEAAARAHCEPARAPRHTHVHA